MSSMYELLTVYPLCVRKTLIDPESVTESGLSNLIDSKGYFLKNTSN